MYRTYRSVKWTSSALLEIDLSDYPKSLISRINEVYAFSIKYRYIEKA